MDWDDQVAWPENEMRGPWKSLTQPEDTEVISPQGEVRSRVKGHFTGKQVIFDDMSVDVGAGDEIRRRLPNGTDDVYFVEDPTCYTSGPFGPHYQVKVSRRGQYPHATGGHYNVQVSGPNSRVNIGSTDNSTNTVGGDVFAQTREILKKTALPDEEKVRLEGIVTEMERAKDKTSFLRAYQGFMAGLSDHITVFSPVLPVLTALLTRPHLLG